MVLKAAHDGRMIRASQPAFSKATAMKRLVTLINILAFSALYFDYAVAMDPPQPAGTRRFLQIYAGQLPTGTYPTRKPVWEMGYGMADVV
jgi:hypothetical protein